MLKTKYRTIQISLEIVQTRIFLQWHITYIYKSLMKDKISTLSTVFTLFTNLFYLKFNIEINKKQNNFCHYLKKKAMKYKVWIFKIETINV